jgi:PAS domain S-box-containing protein
MLNVYQCLATQHDWRLVVLAVLVCMPATLAAFFIYSKVPAARPLRRWTWFAMTGLIAGSGIWTTHFLGMLAFRTGLSTGYDAPETLGSLVLAVAGTAVGFAIAATPSSVLGRSANAILGGLVVGLAITLMHYVGMAGYRTAGVLTWAPAYVAASVLIGSTLSAGALYLARSGARVARHVAAAAMLGLAILGMHFTGMSAVSIAPDPTIAVSASLMSNGMMAAIAIGVTGLIVITALAAVALDGASRSAGFRRLREAIDAMPQGLAFYDAEDRLVTWNALYADICRSNGQELHVGLQFADLLQSTVARGGVRDAVGRGEAWRTERLAARRAAGSPMATQLADGRWLQITERRTAGGGTASVLMDITELKQAEVAMGQARDRAEELAQRAEFAETVAGLGQWRLDLATREVVWSAQMYRIYGLEPGSPLDVDAQMAMNHPEDADEIFNRLQELIEGASARQTVTRIVRPNGQVRYMDNNLVAERGPGGEVVAVVGTAIDITDRRTAELAMAESEERYRRLADNAPDMITESLVDGTLTYVSPACLAILGWTADELIGRSAFSFMEPDDAAAVREMCTTVIRSKGAVAPWPLEVRSRHRSGREIWLECTPTPSFDSNGGPVNRINDVIRDITQRKRMETQLRAAQADAEAATSVKAEFLANMSHELRTPLTSIIGFTSLAAKQPDLSELTRTYVERVADASRALLATVNDVLDFSKLEAGQVSIDPQPASLGRLSRATLDLFTPQAGAKDLILTLDGDAGDSVIAIDADRVRQVLLNLVGNAVKFTLEGGVTLRTRYQRDAATLTVEVVDTGPGIAPDKLDLLFKRFSQVDGSLTRTQGGTGLGLAICKGLVEAMGGEIGVESRMGEGTRFWFTVPAQPATLPGEAAAGKDEEQDLAAGGMRVLVADDHATNRELARLFLAAVGADVTEACDGEEAVAIAEGSLFDVVLMDLRMPKLDGLGALLRIRASQGPNAATPILAFTADAGPAIAEELEAMGFQGVVAKPIDPRTLIAAVARAASLVGDVESDAFAAAG